MDYSQVVAEGRIEKLKEIAERIVTQFPCKVISHPSPGMVMVKHIDPIEKTAFYLGEAFVTQCEVEVDGNLGYGCVLGDEPERALYGAIIDSVVGSSHGNFEEVNLMLELEKAYIISKWSGESKQISKTKVNFDVKKG
jgi:phosphonate C-P lyase system protein PhnG